MKAILSAVVVVAIATPAWAQSRANDVNSDPFSPTGVPYADPAEDVATILEEMKAFEAPVLGLALAPTPQGDLLVIGIRSASPAARAGLRRGDFIVKINGEEVPPIEKLREAVREGKRAESAKLHVWRGGEESELEILLLDPSAKVEARPWAGLQCDEVEGTGLVVKGVYPGGPAAKAGLQVGDVIVSAAGNELKSFVDAEKYLKGLKPFAESEVVVLRDGERHALTVKMASLHETPEGLVLETEEGKSEALSAGTPGAIGGAPAPAEMGWEAEQHHRMEMLLQEIRHDLQELKTKIENREKKGS